MSEDKPEQYTSRKRERPRYGFLNMKERSMKDYFELLGVSQGDLGHRVLDIGSGKTELFARELAVLGVDVVSVNPLKGDKKIREKTKILCSEDRPELPKTGAVVSVNVLNLPFTEGSFDSAVALWSVPYYLNTQDSDYRGKVAKMVDEVLRVLKKGGHGYFHPLYGFRLEVLESVLAEKNVKFDRRELAQDVYAQQYKFYNPNAPYFTVQIEKSGSAKV